MDSPRALPETGQPVTLTDIREAIGGLIILWSTFEANLRNEVASLDPAAKPCFGAAVIDAWATLVTARITNPTERATVNRFLGRIEAARKVRNGICHEFEGYSADPFGYGGNVELNFRSGGQFVSIPYAALQRIMIDLATSAINLNRVTAVARDPASSRTDDLLAQVDADLDRIMADNPSPPCAFLHP